MRGVGFWIGMIIGAAVGAAIGMIYAPKPGGETRGQVAEGVRKLREAAAEKGRTMLRRGKAAAEEKKGELQQGGEEQMAEQS